MKPTQEQVIATSKINKGLLTSTTDQWATPQDFFDACEKQYGKFGIDVCADASNAKCVKYFDKQIDGLKQTIS